MEISYLTCDKTGERVSPGLVKSPKGFNLSAHYDFSKLHLDWTVLRRRPFNHWRYQELFPDSSNRITLGEGGTPLIPSTNFEESLGIDLRFKLESSNPTGSFKDRGSTVGISNAFKNAEKVVVASTGNMGASVAAYCARANLSCRVYVPRGAAPLKKKHILFHGAELTDVRGDYNTAEKEAFKDSEKHGYFLAGDYYLRAEGEKSVGFEIIDEMLFSSESPDFIVLPVGNGTLMKGVYKGLREFRELGLIQRIPKLVGVQAQNCSPLYQSFQHEWKEIHPVENPVTIASAISCGNPLDGIYALRAIRETNGFAISVSESEISKSRRLLSRREGIFAEEAGAVALTGIIKEKNRFRNKKVVAIVTGHGLKSL